MTTNSRLMVVSALALGAGCGADGLGERSQDVVAPTLETFITDAPGIQRFKGFNEVYDTTVASCLKRCSEDARTNVHSDESGLQVSFVSTASDVASNRTFSLDANVEMALWLGNIEANASMKIASKANFSRRAVRMMLIANRWFKASHDETVEIDSAKVDPDLLLRSKASSAASYDDRLRQFIGRCGSVYTKETLHGAYLFALYEFTSTDESKLTGLEAKLGAAFKSHVGKIGGGVNTSAETELNTALSSVQWTVQVVAKGFKVNGREGGGEGQIALEQDGRAGLDLKRIVGFFDAMQTSVGDDMTAMQRGDDNHPLSVFPLGLVVGYFPLLLKNVEAEEVIQARARMSDIMSAHDRMLQTYGRLATGLLNGRDEVKKFLALSEAYQAQHQVMKWPGKTHTPALKLRSGTAGLLDRVEPYARSLDPRSGSGAASELADRVDFCWRRGRSGDLKVCLPDVDKPVDAATGNAAFIAALALLKKYNDSDRPVWMNYWITSGTIKRADADCGNGHLPTDEESSSLGIVAYYRVPVYAPGYRQFWLQPLGADPALPCSYRRWVGDSWEWWKTTHNSVQPRVCVNGDLFPSTLPQLYPPGGF